MANPTTLDPKTVRGVNVLVACGFCKEQGRLPGGKYQTQGEVINCPVCNGRRTVPQPITLAQLGELLQQLPRKGSHV